MDKIELMTEQQPSSIAFPENIGCGRGGGDWETYRTMIERFARKNIHIRVAIVQCNAEQEEDEGYWKCETSDK